MNQDVEIGAQIRGHDDRLAKLEREVSELRGSVSSSNRLTIWQFVAFTGALAATLFGTVRYTLEPLRYEMDARFKAVDQRFDALEKRIDQSERNILARFDDLKAVVLTRQGGR